MAIVEYNTGEPTETGVYACRVKDFVTSLYIDRYLLWNREEKRWYYCLSDQRYRDPVLYWIGPLRRKMP